MTKFVRRVVWARAGSSADVKKKRKRRSQTNAFGLRVPNIKIPRIKF